MSSHSPLTNRTFDAAVVALYSALNAERYFSYVSIVLLDECEDATLAVLRAAFPHFRTHKVLDTIEARIRRERARRAEKAVARAKAEWDALSPEEQNYRIASRVDDQYAERHFSAHDDG